SPSAGEILHGADGKIESFALLYRRGRAAAISVVTEEDFFGGRPEWVPRAKSISGLPVLMKDFVVSERQLDFAVSLGADAVLLIVRALSDEELAALRRGAKERGLAAVVEAHDAAQIRRAAAADPDVLGVNARDLSTFSTDLDALAAMAKEIPPGPVRLAESGIRTRDEIVRLTDAGFQAFLVGETLLRAEDPEEELRSLRG
ncbi:MAG: indole-3-glycerol-phosphate synthase, partial [Thermoanaerobaculia bacterium]